MILLLAASVLLQVECGYAGYRTCYLDPAAYGEPRTPEGCRAAAILAFGVEDGPTIKCVPMEWRK